MLMPVQLDGNGVEVLSRCQCLELLGRAAVGRVVVTDKALPAAFPVSYALLDDDVVFLTSTGSKLEAAALEAVVAFQVDEVDVVRRGGWSVLVQGPAGPIVDPGELARARALPLELWAPFEGTGFVRVRSAVVSGRRLLPRGADVE